MNNFPRLPVKFVEGNSDLLKSVEASSGGCSGATDYSESATEPVLTAHMDPQYRTPMGRENGNVVFRRYPNGDLDLEAAKHIVVDILHKAKDKSPLTTLEELIVGCMFPGLFAFVDSRIAGSIMDVQLRLAPWECDLITRMVSAHLLAETNYNAGMGGGSVPGREVTRS